MAARPLTDRALSRRPITLRQVEGGAICLDPGASRTRLVIDGLDVTGERVLSTEQLERGVELLLSDRVLLMLHRVPVPLPDPPDHFGMVGESPALLALCDELARVADLEIPLLLRGATGTGKELAARAVHLAGSRCSGPFLAINLAAVPHSLAAGELFGAVKGAFTGADRSRQGYFRRADGGTLLLDEIGEASPEVQTMLLRVLETGEVFPLGSSTPHRVDVRLVAATDAPLDELVASGGFKAPLLHRLAGYQVRLPSLDSRRDDIARLAVHFLRAELEAAGEAGRLERPDATTWLPPWIMAQLVAHSWPGNVRELRNAVRHLVVHNRGRQTYELGGGLELQVGPDDERGRDVAAGTPRDNHRRPSEISDGELEAALAACSWDLSRTAANLGISRPSLYLLIERHPSLRTAGGIGEAEIRRAYEACDGDLALMARSLEVSRHALKRRVRELGLHA